MAMYRSIWRYIKMSLSVYASSIFNKQVFLLKSNKTLKFCWKKSSSCCIPVFSVENWKKEIENWKCILLGMSPQKVVLLITKRCFEKNMHNTVKKFVISPNFLVWKFCGKAQFPYSFGWFARNYGIFRSVN